MRRSRKCNSTNRKAIVLCILAGDIQIGKPRWLQALVSDLEARGAVCDGVIAPGVWCEDEAGCFDKLGIDNELPPTHEGCISRDMFDLPRRAEMRFAAAWGGSKRISLTDETRDKIVASLLGR